jgi:two-component system LytT family response regulator
MKVLIIEDEYRNAKRLQKMLVDYDAAMQIDGPLESVADARTWLHSHQGEQAPDIIFSDIRLNDGVSFDALGEACPSSIIVFTTAYDEYALQAFRFNGLAYLMKPIDSEELIKTLQRIQQMQFSNKGLQQLLMQMKSHQMKYRERFLVSYKDGFEVVSVADISHICTEYKDTRLYLKDGNFYSISMSLEEIENQLNPAEFFRVNRQYIINIDGVSSIKNYFVGKLRVILTHYPDAEVMCSRERATQLKNWLNK